MKLAQTVAHFFYPQHSNNHRGFILHKRVIIGLTLLLVLYQSSLHLVTQRYPQVLGYAANISTSDVISLTNQKRAESGLPPLKENPVLSQAAYAKGQDMLADDYWAHVAPDGTEPWAFFQNFGYKYRYAGENLARDFSNASAAVDAWMASPTHRDNLLSDHYDEIGIGVIEGDLAGADTTLIVQFFGRKYTDTPTEVLPVAQAAAQEETTVLPTVTPLPTATSDEEQSPLPTIKPTPIASSTPAAPIAEAQPTNPPGVAGNTLVSPFTVTKGISIGLISLLVVALIVDMIVISRKKLTRVTGRTFAHLAFFGMILAIIFIARAGEIL